MEFTLFMIFSFIETVALYYFMFRLFKVDLHLPAIAFASLIGSYTSFTLRVSLGIPNIDIIIQISLVIAFLWLLFQVPIYYAILMACTCYAAYVFIQIPLYFLFTSIAAIPPELDPTGNTVYLVQVSTAFVISITGWLLHRRRKGFSFIPHSSFVRINLKSYQIALLVLYSLTFCSVPVAYFLFEYSPIFSITPIFIGLLLVLCLYAAYRSDRSHD